MYVTLEPCSMCAGAIINSRIKKFIYGTTDEKTGAVGSVLNLLEDYKFNLTLTLIVVAFSITISFMLKI